ncbi:uncharacterized protein LAJ45_00932 [Morchella importuna]|uniref:RNase H type-1 domain-containing protein n=1 Tax=Morchella conica CCBAS932 TaxID=1392247 RepID=A0A3N4K9H3_9PEZI|nr:uncharacterized protein LAJ45_00932 [Morchella importuna]KAH8154405.1 hypothetical protein LAJ45_00932 [Morchella importuna]RPB07156.1 hypothetical protein P167DRAFT_579554 [Morchella conica CCBAS932]
MSTNSEDPNSASSNLVQARRNNPDPLILNCIQPGISVISSSISSPTDGLSIEDTLPQNDDPNLQLLNQPSYESNPMERDMAGRDLAAIHLERPASINMVTSAYSAGDYNDYNERGFFPPTGQDSGELKRVEGVLASASDARHIIINTDSEYILRCVKNWRPLWERYGFVDGEGNSIADYEVIKSILNIIDRRTLNNKRTTFKYIEGISEDLCFIPPIRPANEAAQWIGWVE